MSFLSKLHAIEKEVAAYAETAGKDIETVFEEIKAFLVGKTVEAQNTAAATGNAAGVPVDAAANSTVGSGESATAASPATKSTES